MKYKSIFPEIVNAIQFTRKNIDEFKEFVGEHLTFIRCEKRPDGEFYAELNGCVFRYNANADAEVCNEGDFVIMMPNGPRIMAKDDFLNLYQPIKED